MSNRYKFYEVVKISSALKEHESINNKVGVILGMIEVNNSEWIYAVQILDNEEGWDIEERYINSCNKFLKKEDLYPGENIKIIVDLETGKGKIK